MIILLSFVVVPEFAQSLDTSGNDQFITIFLRGYVRDDDRSVLAISGSGTSPEDFYALGVLPFSSPVVLSDQGWRNIYQYWLTSAKQNSYYNPSTGLMETAAYTSDIYMREIGDFTNGWAPD